MQEENDNTFLDDIYSNDTAHDQTQEEIASSQQEIFEGGQNESVEQNSGEKATDETPSSEPVKEKDVHTVPLDAFRDERQKRQQLQQELDYIKQQFEQKQEDPDYYEDPDTILQNHKEAISQEVFNSKVEMSQEMMRQVHQDYDEVEALFVSEAEKNPVLAIQLRQSPIPAKFAYEHGKKLKFMNDIGDPDAYRQKIEQEAIEKYKAELARSGQTQQLDQALSTQPSSLAKVSSSTTRTNVQDESVSLSDIYRD